MAEPKPQIIRSKRKTISLMVTETGELIVRVPRWAPMFKIRAAIREKAAWIEAQRERMRRIQAEVQRAEIQNGSRVWLYGEAVTVAVKGMPLAEADGKKIKIRQAEDLSAEAEHWFRLEARRYLGERVDQLSKAYNLPYNGVRIMSARTRWASCGSKNRLNFTWRLIMAPREVIDYVIIHELVHTRVRSHSTEFWAGVEQCMPDYRVWRSWLKRNGRQLELTLPTRGDRL